MAKIENIKGENNSVLYIVLTILALVVALPLAVATSKSDAGDLFVECFDNECDQVGLYAELKD